MLSYGFVFALLLFNLYTIMACMIFWQQSAKYIHADDLTLVTHENTFNLLANN